MVHVNYILISVAQVQFQELVLIEYMLLLLSGFSGLTEFDLTLYFPNKP